MFVICEHHGEAKINLFRAIFVTYYSKTPGKGVECNKLPKLYLYQVYL